VIVLDANVMIGVFYPSDAHHDKAAALLERHAAHGFIVHPITLAESLVGAAKVGRLNQVRRQIQNMGIDVFVPDDDEPVLIAELRSNTGLKLPDCCVLAASLGLSAPLLSFDDKLIDCARGQSIDLITSSD
jgi:predicted nucleic acid-binding protein